MKALLFLPMGHNVRIISCFIKWGNFEGLTWIPNWKVEWWQRQLLLWSLALSRAGATSDASGGNKRHPTIVTHPTACHRTQKVRSAFKITVKNLYKNNYFIVLMSFKGYYLSGLIFFLGWFQAPLNLSSRIFRPSNRGLCHCCSQPFNIALPGSM